MMRLALAIATIALAGCTTVEVQRVEIPVPVPCLDRTIVPVAPASKLDEVPATAPMDQQVKAILHDRESDQLYGRKLRALVEACVIQ